MRAIEDQITSDELADCLAQMRQAVQKNDMESGRQLVHRAVREYSPSADPVQDIHPKIIRG